MEAIDTVIAPEQIGEIVGGCKQWWEIPAKIAQAQAEISFPKGEKQGIDKALQWLSEQPKEDAFPDGGMYILVAVDKWQAKLKEWGLLRQEMPK